MGAFVVLTLYGEDWVAYRGAQTLERAKEYRRELPQWPDEKVKIVPNEAP